MLPRVLSGERLRTAAFRFVSELGIEYRTSIAVLEGAPSLAHGPRAGERLPDARVVLDGRETTLQREVVRPRVNVLLCGSDEAWAERAGPVARLVERYRGLVVPRRLGPSPAAGTLVDVDGVALRRLGVAESGVYAVRPDGYVGYRCAGTQLAGLEQWLERWLT